MASLVSGNVAVRYDESSGVVGAVVLASASRLAAPTGSSMDTSEGPNSTSLVVKAESPEHLAGTSTTVSAVSGPVGTGTGLFAGIASSNKRPRPDDWLTPNSPSSPQNPMAAQHLIYTTPQQQLSQQQQQQQQQQQPPLAHSTPLGQSQQAPPQAPNNNGYASPMSSGSYDPYSPNGKIGKFELKIWFCIIKFLLESFKGAYLVGKANK